MSIERILKKNFWAVLVLMLGIAAFFTARAFSQGLSVALGADEKQLTAPPLQTRNTPSTSSSTAHVTSAEAVLSRNPFDHTTGALKDEPKAEEVVDTQPDYSDPSSAPPCDGVKVLLIAAASEPEWSITAIQGPGESKSVLRRIGQEVGGKKIEGIGWKSVWLSSGRSLCQAELFKEGTKSVSAPPPVAVATPMPERPSGGAPAVDPSIMKGIQKLSANEFNIDRGTVDKILENQADLMRTARIVPEKEGDKVVGIRLYGVRPETLLGVLGMENGDRLQTINGFDMASPEKALEAYARLRTAEKLVVQVNRRGQPVNLDYNIK
jgi:general secretion pathway protein C